MTATNLAAGRRIELDITTVAFGGDGIGRIDNFVVFVPFVLEGERVEAEIVDVKKRYATADLIRVITPSPLRVEPRCDYYRQCAGCQYQHVEYAHQLELKRRQIRDIFQRIGGIADPPVEPVIASPKSYGYRNKIVVHGPVDPASKDWKLGFWTVRGRSIIAIDHCPIAREEINQKLSVLSSQLSANKKHLTIRCNSEGQVWVFGESRGTGVSPVHSGEAGQVGGVPHIEETVLGKTLQVPLDSFFQVNQGVIELALEHVRKIFASSGCKILVDAYCGVGLFALLLGDLAHHVYGMELDKPAVAAANENAALRDLKNYDFYAGSTDRLLFYTLRQINIRETCLILDPPRSGCGKAVLKTLREQKPGKIIYVSCAPAMLARDSKELIRFGYKLERVTPFDMFPQTAHCEAVAELTVTGR